MMRLFRYLKSYKWPIAIVLALVFVQSLSDLYLPTLMADIVDIGIVHGDTQYIWKIGGIMLFVAAGGGFCSIGASYFSSQVATGFGRKLRARVFKQVEHFSMQEIDQIGTASLITRTTNDINQVQQVLIMILRIMVAAPMMCIGGIIMALSKDAKLTIVLAVAVPILALAIFLIARKGLPLFKAIQKKLDKLNLVVREGLTGIRVIRSFNRIEKEQNRFTEANTDLMDTAVKVNRIMAALMPIMMLTFNLSAVAILWYGGIRISNMDLQVGDLMAFIQYATQIMFSLVMLSMIFVMVPRASASAVRINEVLDVNSTIFDRPEASVKTTKQTNGLVELENVTFTYPGAENPALSSITFTARPGQTTAIIGGTGSGKSTILNLVERFYDVTSGAIRVDGVDIRHLPLEQLRANIGYVPQKVLLFSGSIADNIRFGKEDATDAEIEHAAKIAQAGDFIASMNGGYEAHISQGGTNVSGGQKQRLSIARAIVRQPSIYMFDDSFSALDFKTDALLRAALKEEIEKNQSTLIIVAQRVSTVMDAEQIIVLDEGSVAGMGTHHELMQNCEVYQEIVRSQLTEEEIA
ncbi:ABC transporter ATP-binding protein [Brevibacillus antibioticus]|uniref:ABC transporter ATP-binding protein n=1 Tax=Brevibacillus antibioticus TaxID=2570228 RepID=A0A4U2Y504_9BACL|nr:ABC transporter ATP-binding protein [Brevibacillus antibioticus]TKI55539.1 ABC transporter ATP-binding protein [Brevibacillus antibioticus]